MERVSTQQIAMMPIEFKLNGQTVVGRPDEPIITVLHLACPRIEYLDRGKSSVSLPS